jgi:uncharacterized protein
MKKILLFPFLLVLLLNCSNSSLPKVKIKINKKEYVFEVAATEKSRQIGLMNRKSMKKDTGMLFVYGKKEPLYFYMKNTYIPLDIAFIDEEYKVVDIQSMQPLDETTIASRSEAMYALEVNKDFFKNVDLKVGDKLDFVTPVPYYQE